MAELSGQLSDIQMAGWEKPISIMDKLSGKLLRLEYSFRYTGSGGPPARAVRDVRKTMEGLIDEVQFFRSALEYPDEDIKMLSDTLSKLADSFTALQIQILRYVSFYFDDMLFDAIRGCQSCIKHEVLDLRHPASTESQFLKRKQIFTAVCKIGLSMGKISSSLNTFITIGISTIRRIQQEQMSSYLIMTTIATFFCAVAATTLQFTFTQTDRPIDNAVNSCLFLSVTFSVASAANGLMAMSWKQSYVQAPESHLSLLMETWLTKGPVLSLYLSGAAYSVGFCLFSFSSNQHIITRTLTLLFAAIYGVGLTYLYATFVLEKWKFRKLTKSGKGLVTYRSALIEVLEFLVSIRWAPEGKIDEKESAKTRPTHKESSTDVLQQSKKGLVRSVQSLSASNITPHITPAPYSLQRRASFPTDGRKILVYQASNQAPTLHERHNTLYHQLSESVKMVFEDL